MIAVIFEVWPAAGQQQAYLDMAARLKAELQGIDGFISIERFESLAEPGKLLSLSFWRDEAAVAAWRARPPTAPRKWPVAPQCSPTTGCAWPRCAATTAWSNATRRRPIRASSAAEGPRPSCQHAQKSYN